ncbi:MAG: rod shape-determining protein MreD [bacterium]
MQTVIMIFLLVLGGLLQSLIPAMAWIGLSKPPVLLAVVIYFALTHPRGLALTAAIVAGIIQDSLSLFPIGYSSLCFVVFVAVLVRTRETLFRDSLFTVAVLGAVLAALATLSLYLMLRVNALVVSLPAWWVGLKMGGNALLGLVSAPAVWWLASALERHVGVAAEREAH